MRLEAQIRLQAEKLAQAERAKYARGQEVEPVCPLAGECQGGGARHAYTPWTLSSHSSALTQCHYG